MGSDRFILCDIFSLSASSGNTKEVWQYYAIMAVNTSVMATLIFADLKSADVSTRTAMTYNIARIFEEISKTLSGFSGGKHKMARLERFELPTNWFEASYSIQLSYRRILS